MSTTTFRTHAAHLMLAAALLAAVGAAHASRTRIGIGVNIGYPAYGYGGYGWRGYRPYYGGYGPYWGGYYGAGVVVAAPPIIYAEPADPPVVVQRAPLVAQAQTSARPDPVIYPRNGQTAQQTESDRQQCNRWATTQPAAVADAAVFMRAIEACMDGRGYSVK